MVRRGVRGYLRLRPRTRAGIAEQVDEEIALHIELRVAELVARGMPPEQARAEAERRFGGVSQARLQLQRSAEHRERSLTMSEWLAGWAQDFGYSARALAREPLVALVVVLTLALGIGANATMFGIIDQLLLRGPAHVQAPEQVRRVYLTYPGPDDSPSTTGVLGYVASTVLRTGTDVFDDVAVYRYSPVRFGRGEQAREGGAGFATARLFPLLGVSPALGRFFDEAEDRPFDAQRVAVLEHAYWQSQYGGSHDVLGGTIVIDDEEFTIIGVAPRGFTGPQLEQAQAWVPLSTGYEPRPDWPETWQAMWVSVLTRVKPGVPLAQAEAAATAAYRAAAAEAAQRNAAELQLSLRPASYTIAGAEPPEIAVSRWLVGVSLVVLLVACANVVNLLVARGLRRRRELAVRLALGVSRRRLMRLLLSESLLLAGAGGLLALAVAGWGGRFLRGVLLPDVPWDAALNVRVLAFTAAAALLTGLAVGLAPVLQAARQDVTEMLKANTRQAGAQRSRLRGALTVLQAAFALVLLVGATLFVRSLWNVHELDLGIEADRVLIAWSSFPPLNELPESERDAARARRANYGVAALERLRARPDVALASRAAGTPLQSAMTIPLRVPGLDSLPRLPGGGPYIIGVDGDYFETVGTRIVHGRGIDDGQVQRGEHVVVVNEPMARALWPGRDPLGLCLHPGRGEDAPCFRVIGVAQQTRRFALVEEPAMQYYVPLGQAGISGASLLVRPARRGAALAPELRRMLHELEPGLNHVDIRPLSRTLDPHVRPWRLGATMFLVFGALALLIAGIGLYSVIAYSVAQRRTELGVRLALGAGAGSIVRLILRQGVALVLLGIAVGMPLALLGGRRLEPLLFETASSDVLSFGGVALVLLLVAVLASVLPAARAGRTDPMEALRAE